MQRLVFEIDTIVSKNIRRIIKALREADYMSHDVFDEQLIEDEVMTAIAAHWLGDCKPIHHIRKFILTTLEDGCDLEYADLSISSLAHCSPEDQYTLTIRACNRLLDFHFNGSVYKAQLSRTGHFLEVFVETCV